MSEFPDHRGYVYILENMKAQRVKVGMTIGGTSTVEGRLRDVSDIWHQRKVTCQVCGGRRDVDLWGKIPRHVVSGRDCIGGDAPPLEKDVNLARSYLEYLNERIAHVSGSERGSVTRVAKGLERRIERYRQYTGEWGKWRLAVVFRTESPWEVEQLSHRILAEFLDKSAPIGEVFCCSVSVATSAVETALGRLGFLHSASKEILS